MSEQELEDLFYFLRNVRTYDDIADMMMQDECDKLIEIVKRELQIKRDNGRIS